MNITIANVSFLITCAETPLLTQALPEAYRSFVGQRKVVNNGVSPVDLVVTTKEMPSLERMEKIFACGDSWAVCREGNVDYLVMNPSLAGGPECVARFDPAYEKVTVYCGKINVVEIEGRKMVRNPLVYPLDQLLMMYLLASKEGALIHAACADINGKGYLFPGRSGAGKSTIARLFASEGYETLSDDRVIIRHIDGLFRSFGTPWPGDAQIAVNRHLPLAGIFFLAQSTANRVVGITPREALEKLLPVTSIPWYDAETMSKILAFLNGLVATVPSYVLYFTPDRSAVDLVVSQG